MALHEVIPRVYRGVLGWVLSVDARRDGLADGVTIQVVKESDGYAARINL
jgi:hypothetical protein